MTTGSSVGEATATLIAAGIGAVALFAAAALGWILGLFSRSAEERLFGPKLEIDCPPGANVGENDDNIYIKVRVRNTRKRLAKSCRAYLIGLREIKDGQVIGLPKLTDSFQLPWAGYDFEARDFAIFCFSVYRYCKIFETPTGQMAIRHQAILLQKSKKINYIQRHISLYYPRRRKWYTIKSSRYRCIL